MEHIPCFVLLALAVGAAVLFFFSLQQQQVTNDALEQVARRFNGQVEKGVRETRVRLQFANHSAVLKQATVGDDPPQTITTFTAPWPDPSLRCEVYPDRISVLRKLLLMQDIEIGSPEFDKAFVIKSNDEAQVRAVLTEDVQSAIFRLAEIPIKFLAPAPHGSIHVKWIGGLLTITKPRAHWRYELLERFVLLSAQLLAPAMAPQGGTIEFIGEVREHGAVESQCQVCGEPLVADLVYCPGCRTPHHRECWDYFGGCSTYACGQKKCVADAGPRKRAS